MSPAVVTQKCIEPKSYIVQTPSGKSLCRNQKHPREDKSSATMNPEVSTPPPVASQESIQNSTVVVMTQHTAMEQTSTVTTNDKHVIYTPHKTPNAHQGTQKTSRSGHMIRPPKGFSNENIS